MTQLLKTNLQINRKKLPAMLKLILRNLGHTLRRYPLPAAINLAGLVVALTAFIIIMSHVEYETTFDRSYPTSGRIFRVDCPGNDETFRSILPNAFARDVINSSAHIEAGTMLMPYLGKLPFYIDDAAGEPHGYELRCDMVQPDFMKVFGVRLTSGDPEALTRPQTAIIPKSMADNLFEGDAVGKTMRTDGNWFFPGGELTVGAVYEDFPSNSNLQNSIYFAVDERVTPYTYGGANFICYLLLDSRESASLVENEFNSNFDFSLSWMSPIELVPIEDIYFMEQGGDGRVFYSGSRSTTILLTAIGILVLLSGVINFANFFTSLAPVRIRSINTQKVVGASTSRLRWMLTMETVVIALIALIISFLLAGWISPMLVSANILKGLFTAHSIGIIVTVSVITIAAGILAGLYPSWYATSFAPALVLKGDFGLSKGGRTFRNVMSGIQYTVAFVTLVFMTFVLLQNRLMRNTILGFDKDEIAVANASATITAKMDMLRSSAQKYPSIAGIAYSSEKVGASDSYSTQGIEYNGENIQMFFIGVDPQFMDVMGIEMVEGRNFNQYDSAGVTVVTRYMMDQFGIMPGDILPEAGEVIGICENVRFNSVREPNTPIAFIPSGIYSGVNGVLYFRITAGSNAFQAASDIESLIREVDPYWPSQVEFYDTIQNNLYQNEIRTSRLVVAFSVIAAILALCGVIGLVLFDTEYRKKETAVRKIFGASVASILGQANIGYGTIVLICFALSCPIAAVITSRWLQNFVDRVHISPWVFALALVAVSAVTALIVTAVFYRRATANPRDGLQ